MKTDMFSMDFNLDYINPEEEEGLDKNEEINLQQVLFW